MPGGKKEYTTPSSDYSIYNYLTSATKSNRYLTGIKLESPKYGEQTANLTDKTKIYNDLTSTVFKAAPGEKLTASFIEESPVDYMWMHGYIYIDTDNNGFTAGVTNAGYSSNAPTGDLKSFSYYQGYNSAGGGKFTGDAEGNAFNPPSFTAPTTPGLYRMRYNMAWNSIDPKGYSSMASTHGNIIDVLLLVEESVSGTQTFNSEAISIGDYYRYLRFTVTESACFQHNHTT